MWEWFCFYFFSLKIHLKTTTRLKATSRFMWEVLQFGDIPLVGRKLCFCFAFEFRKKSVILPKSHICRFTAFLYFQPRKLTKPLNLVIQFYPYPFPLSLFLLEEDQTTKIKTASKKGEKKEKKRHQNFFHI